MNATHNALKIKFSDPAILEHLNVLLNQYYVHELQKNIKKQVEYLQLISKIIPLNVEVYFRLGICQMELNQSSEALQSFQMCLLSDDLTVEYVLKIAQSLSENSFLESKALFILNQRLDSHEDNDPNLYFQLGNLYKKTNDLNKALDCFKESIRLDNKNSDYIKEYNSVFQELAKQELLDAQSQTITDKNAYKLNFQLGLAKKKLFLYQQASVHFKKCFEINQKSSEARYEHADCLISLIDSYSAEKSIRESLILNQDCSITLFKLAQSNYYLIEDLIKTITSLFNNSDSSQINLNKIAEQMIDYCIEVNDIQDETTNKKDKYFSQNENKRYQVTFNMYQMKKQFIGIYKNLLNQSPEFYKFFFNCGLILLINLIIDKLANKFYGDRQKSFVTQHKMEINKKQQLRVKKQIFNKQKNATNFNQHRFIIKFKDDLKCLGEDKEIFKLGLNFSFLLKNEFDFFQLKSLSNKCDIDMSKLFLTYRIFSQDDAQNENQEFKYCCSFNKFFSYYLISDYCKMGKQLLENQEIKIKYNYLVSELILKNNFQIHKINCLIVCLKSDPLDQRALLKFQDIIMSDDNQKQQLRLMLVDCLYDTFVKYSQPDCKFYYPMDIQQTIIQKYSKLDIFKINQTQQDIQQNIDYLKNYNKSVKNDYLSYYILGNIYLSTLQYQQAKYCYYQSLQINPLNERTLFMYAVALNAQRDIDTAVEYLSEVYISLGLNDWIVSHLKSYFQKIDVWYIFNQYYINNYAFYPIDIIIQNLNSKNIKNFLKEFHERNAAIQSKNKNQVFPEDIQKYHDCLSRKHHEICYGLCFFSRFQYFEKQPNSEQKMLKYISKCIEINPQLYQLIYIEKLIQTRHYQQAQTKIHQLIQKNLSNLDFHELQIMYLFELKQYKECIKYIQELQLKFNDLKVTQQFQSYLINSYLQLSEYDKVIAEFEGKEDKAFQLEIIKIEKELKLFARNVQYQYFKDNYLIQLAKAYIEINQPYHVIKTMKKFSDEFTWFVDYCPTIQKIDLKVYKAKQDLVNSTASFKKISQKSIYKVGKDCLKKENKIATINYFIQQIKKYPQNQQSYLILSDLYESTKKIDQQLFILNKLVKLKSNNKSIQQKIDSLNYKQANLLYNAKDYYSALKHFNFYLESLKVDKDQITELNKELDPNNSLIVNLQYCANVLSKLSFNMSHKIEDYDDKIKISYYKIALCYMKENQLLKALNYLQDLTAQYPDQTECYIHIGIIYFEQCNYMESENTFNKLLQFNPEHALALLFLGKLKYIEKDYNKALEYFEKSINVCDKIPETYLSLCQVYIKLREYDYAIACFQVLSNKQRLINLKRKEYGYICYKFRNYHQAIIYLSRDVEGNGANDKLYYRLAESYFQIHAYQEAERYFNKILYSQNHIIRLIQIRKILDKKFEIPKQFFEKNEANINYELALKQFNERRNYEYVENLIKYNLEKYPHHLPTHVLKAWYLLKVEKRVDEASSVLSLLNQEELSGNILGLLLNSKLSFLKTQYQESLQNLQAVLKLDFANEYAFYLKGLIYANQKKIDLAISEFSKNKNHYQSYRKIAKLYEFKKEYSQAKQYYLYAYQIMSWRYENYQNIADMEYQQKKYDVSITYFQKVLKAIKRPDIFILNKIGQAYIEMKKYKEAIEAMTESIMANPNQHKIYYQIGQCQLTLNEFDNAEKSFKSSYERNSKHEETLYELGNIYKRKLDYENAKFYYQLCIAQKKNHDNCLNNLGEIHYKEGNYKEALKFFSMCSAVNRTHFGCLLNQSKILWKYEKNYSACTDILIKIKLLNPTYIPTIKLLLKVYMITKKKEQVSELYSNYSKQFSKDAKMQMRIAQYLFEEKEYASIIKIFENTSEADFNLTGQSFLACCYYLKKEYAKCEGILKKFEKEKIVDNYNYHLLSAFILMRKDIHKKVVYHLKRCTEIDPKQSMPYYYQSLFYSEKDIIKAQQYYNQAVEINHQEDDTIDIKFIQQARIELSKGNIIQGEIILKNCLITFPESELCYYTLGMHYLKNKQFIEAGYKFQFLFSLNDKQLNSIYFKPLSIKEHFECKLGCAEIFEEQGSLEKSLEMVEQCLAINPEYSNALNMKAHLLHKQGNIPSSVICIQKYISNNPTSDKAYFFLGSLHMEQDKFNQAIYFFKKCLNINANYPEIQKVLGRAYEEDCQYESALNEYNNYLIKNPKDIFVLQHIAQIHIRNDNLELAQKYIDDLTSSHQDDSYSFFLKGLIEKKLNKIQDGIKYLKFSLSLNPMNIQALQFLALIYSEINDEENEKQTYETLVSIDSQSTIALNNLAAIYQTKGDYNKAINLYQQCIKIDKYSSEYYSNLGQCYFQQNKLKLALDQLEQGVFVDCQNVECIFNLARVYNALGRQSEAIKEYLRIVKINPNFPPAYYNLAKLLKQQGKTSDAIQFYKECLEKEKANVKCVINLANCLREINEIDQAKKCIKDYIEVSRDTTNSKIQFVLALIYRDLKKHKKEKDILENLCSTHTGQIKYFYNLGIAYKNVGKYQQSIDTLIKCLKMESEEEQRQLECQKTKSNEEENQKDKKKEQSRNSLNDQIYLNLGDCYHLMKMVDKEIECYLKSIQINPQSTKCYNNLGLAYQLQNQIELAKQAFLNHSRLHPKEYNCLFNLGNVYYCLNDFYSAIKYYKLCLEISPSHLDFLHNYALGSIKLKLYSQAIDLFQQILFTKPNDQFYIRKIKQLQLKL